ncbi:MAG: ATP synthase F1 subunit epsilon [Roseibacillus sp.]|nr:ATP synthase F1 subunit epsilon [Roseibacillus sp.]|tara:strand:- start:308 stop:724 length:417 start_codon:yes stop_codon:yes gene_type:complete
MALTLDIVTPEKKSFSGEVENVYLPGTEGELGILPGHVPLVTGINPGELRYSVNGQVEELAIGAGFVEVSQEKVTVLTDLAVTDAEIDEAKVEEAMKRAEEALTQIGHSENTEEVAALQGAIAKSMAQLKLKRKRRQI